MSSSDTQSWETKMTRKLSEEQGMNRERELKRSSFMAAKTDQKAADIIATYWWAQKRYRRGYTGFPSEVR
jgi:hypothetical protein